MTYTFKLSRRLAVGRALPVCAIALLAACDVGDPLGSGSDVAGDLILSPARVTAEPYQNIRLAFRDPVDGAWESSYDVEWTVIGGGTISPDGSFTATAPGMYQVVGKKGKENASDNGKSNGNGHKVDTSTVVVVPPPPSLASVELTPATASLEAGEHLQLEATGRNDDGSTVAIGVEWTATGGTIDAGGYYIAGSEGGEYRVIARHPGTGLADTARLTVASAAEPVPPPPSDDDAPGGDSDGFEVISDRRFDAKVEAGWNDRGDSHFSIVEKSGPTSPTSVGEAKFPKGFPSGSGPISTSVSLGSSRRELVVRFDVQLSSNWDGNDAGVNKIFFIWIHDKPVVCLSAQGTGSNPLTSQVRLQNTPVGARNLAPNLASGRIERGQWAEWEIRLIANTPGKADGEVHWSINGVKVGEYRDVMFSGSSEANVWQQLQWNPTYGGAGEPVPADQYMWMDHVYVAGR